MFGSLLAQVSKSSTFLPLHSFFLPSHLSLCSSPACEKNTEVDTQPSKTFQRPKLGYKSVYVIKCIRKILGEQRNGTPKIVAFERKCRSSCNWRAKSISIILAFYCPQSKIQRTFRWWGTIYLLKDLSDRKKGEKKSFFPVFFRQLPDKFAKVEVKKLISPKTHCCRRPEVQA